MHFDNRPFHLDISNHLHMNIFLQYDYEFKTIKCCEINCRRIWQTHVNLFVWHCEGFVSDFRSNRVNEKGKKKLTNREADRQ